MIGCFWIVAPPLFFLFEYFYIYPRWGRLDRLEHFKIGQELAGKCWVASLVILYVCATGKLPGRIGIFMLLIETLYTGDAAPTARLTLNFDARTKSRLRTQLADGEEVGLFLPRGTILRGGDRLQAADGRIVEVVSAPEDLIEARCADAFALARAAYHLGNRHVAVQVGAGWLRIQADHVLETPCSPASAPKSPASPRPSSPKPAPTPTVTTTTRARRDRSEDSPVQVTRPRMSLAVVRLLQLTSPHAAGGGLHLFARAGIRHRLRPRQDRSPGL